MVLNPSCGVWHPRYHCLSVAVPALSIPHLVAVCFHWPWLFWGPQPLGCWLTNWDGEFKKGCQSLPKGTKCPHDSNKGKDAFYNLQPILFCSTKRSFDCFAKISTGIGIFLPHCGVVVQGDILSSQNDLDVKNSCPDTYDQQAAVCCKRSMQ